MPLIACKQHAYCEATADNSAHELNYEMPHKISSMLIRCMPQKSYTKAISDARLRASQRQFCINMLHRILKNA